MDSFYRHGMFERPQFTQPSNLSESFFSLPLDVTHFFQLKWFDLRSYKHGVFRNKIRTNIFLKTCILIKVHSLCSSQNIIYTSSCTRKRSFRWEISELIRCSVRLQLVTLWRWSEGSSSKTLHFCRWLPMLALQRWASWRCEWPV